MTVAAQTISASAWKARPAGALSLFRKGSWGLADQMLISFAHFATMVLVARGLGPAAFGAFTLVHGLLLFTNSVQSALILQPHGVLTPSLRGEQYARYTTSTAFGQLVLAAAAALLATFAAMAVQVFGWPGAALLLALAPAMVAVQAQEFVRRTLYHEDRLRAAFFNDVICYGCQIVTLAALWHLRILTGPLALYTLAWTSAAAAAVGCWQIRRSLSGRLDRSAWRKNWDLGKWLGGAELGHWFSAEIYLYMAAALLGTSATGALKAASIIFGPTRVLGYFLRTILPNRFARTLVQQGKGALHKQVKQIGSVAAPVMGLYCLAVAAAAAPLVRLVYGDHFSGYATVVALYSVSAFITLVAGVVSSALRAKQLARNLFTSQLQASVIALPLGWVLISLAGVEGAVVGIIVTNLIVITSNWIAYRRDHDDDSRAQAEANQQEQSRSLTNAATPAAAVPPAVVAEADSIAAGKVLRRLFHTLDHAGIRYCALHGYESYPDRVSSDVDCMVEADVLPSRLAAVLEADRERLGARVVQWFEDAAHFIVLAGRGRGGSLYFLQFHAHARYDVSRRTIYQGKEVLGGRKRYGPFWIPAPDVEFGCYLSRRIHKGKLDEQDARRLAALYRQDPGGCRRQTSRFWAAEHADLIAAAADSGDWEQVRLQLGQLSREQRRRARRAFPVRTARNWLSAAVGRVRRWWRADRGLNIVFLGPDGSGKSSVIEALRRDLAPAFTASERRTFPPGLRRRNTGTNSTPHEQRPRSCLSSVVRAVCYWFVYYTAGYPITTRRALANGALVLHDRHLVDALVDPRRYRYGGPAWLLCLVCRLVPRPDMVIFLDAPVEVVQSRKREVPPEETSRQLEEYRALAARLPNAHSVSTDRPLDAVVHEMEELILDALARRSARRLGQEPARTSG